MSDQTPASYRPSAYYFRRELRNTRSKAQAIAVGLHVVRELGFLEEWAKEQGLSPLTTAVPVDELRGAKNKAQTIDAGLCVVRELEKLKEFVREQGLIPPRRFIMKAEIADKDLSQFCVSSPPPAEG